MSDMRQASREFLSEFIEMYRSFPCLWQVKSKDYSDRNKKDLAYVELVTKYKEIDPSADRDIVVKKINSFRTVFKKEMTKVNKSQKSGAGADEVYKPKLWYFDLLQFLNDVEPSRKPKSTLDDSDEETVIDADNTEEDLNLDIGENVDAPQTPQTPQTTQQSSQPVPSLLYSRPSKRKLNQMEQATLDTMKKLGQKIDSVKEEDPFDVFGKHVADRLRNLKSSQVKFAQKLISDVLFEGDMESLNRYCKITGIAVDPIPHFSGPSNFINDHQVSMMQPIVNPQQQLFPYIHQSSVSPCPSSYGTSGSSTKDFVESYNPNN